MNIKCKIRDIKSDHINYEFECGDLWLRKKVSKWEDLEFCFNKHLEIDLKDLRKKIKKFDLKLNYTLPNLEQIKNLKKNQKYKIENINKHFIHPLYLRKNILYVDECFLGLSSEISEGIYNLVYFSNVKEIFFSMCNLQGSILGKNYFEDENYVQKKLKQKKWWLGYLEIEERIHRHGTYGNDLDELIYLRDIIDTGIKFNFANISKKQQKILKKHEII